MNSRPAAIMTCILLAGCAGGGGSSPAPPRGDAPPTASPANASGSATLTLGVPRANSSARRAPQYVSPNSAFLVVTVKTVNGQPPTAAQVPAALNPQKFVLSTAPGGNCTTSPTGETCAVTIAAPTGQVTYQFDLLDASAQQNKLATNTLTFTVAAGSAPNLQAQLDGIVSTVTVTAPTLTAGTSFSGPITVQAFDASGALIVGAAPYANPYTLTDNDATGATSLTDNVTGSVVTVAGPNDVVILNFDGEDIDPFTMTAGVPGNPSQTAGTVQVTHSPVTFPGTPNGANPIGPNFNQPTVTFTSTPSTKQFTAAQAGWSDHGTHGFTVALDVATCGTGAAAVVTIAAAAGTNNRTFNATSQHAGLCKGTVTGGPPGHPQSAVIWFSAP